MTHKYLILGFVVDAFSLDGTLKIISKTNFAKQRYKKGNAVLLVNAKSGEQVTVHAISFRQNGLFDFVKFEEINTNDEALKYKGFEVRAEKDYSHLAKETYYFDDLIGCQVVNEQREVLGVVKEVEEFPAQLTLRVARKNQKDFFVPFIKVFIRNVDIDKKLIEINVIEGLL